MSRVAIIDYGNGNANSIKAALGALGANSIYTRNENDIDAADFLILPGVGHHAAAMNALREGGLLASVNRAARQRRIPTLGICLGMQLMTISSEEGGAAGLGWVEAATTKIVPADPVAYKVPHVGWNLVRAAPRSVLLKGVDVGKEPFYFCHSYTIQSCTPDVVSAPFRYERDYVALFEQGNLFGVQFHPEKSQEPGLRLLANFLELK